MTIKDSYKYTFTQFIDKYPGYTGVVILRDSFDINIYGIHFLKNGAHHREHGKPAISWSKAGSLLYIVEGKFHRLDGPAIKWSDNCKEWHVDGIECKTEEEFKLKAREYKLRKFINEDE